MKFNAIPNLTEKDVRRIWSKVARSATEGECWLWQGEMDGRYGKVPFCRDAKKTEIKAHRIIYFLTTGIDPLTKVVCHTCDNPPCVNPAHLFLGTQGDNLKDMVRKGRNVVNSSKGEANPGAKLSNAAVGEIREKYARGDCTHRELAAEYGVARSLISRLLLGRQWTHVTGGEKVETRPRDRKLKLARVSSAMEARYELCVRRAFNYGFDVYRPGGTFCTHFMSLADIERTYLEGLS